MAKDARLEVRIHSDLEYALESKAERLSLTKSEYVRMILTEALMG